jgi:ATP-binding cassette subfamily B protein
MLLRLLGTYLKPHWKLVVGVIVFQLGSSVASLYLPTLNADIIDIGVVGHNTGYILSTGGVMLLISLGQIVCAIIAVYFGARVAMSAGRDLRAAVFAKVGEFSEREVAQFGAPSLITRSTNDVQQVQMLVLMTCTLLVSAPILSIGGIIAALRFDLPLSSIFVVSIPVLLIAVGLIISRMVPLFRRLQARIDTVNRVLREQLTGIRVVRAFVREDVETARFARANADVTELGVRTGRLFALMFPTVLLILNVSSVAVLWFGAYRVQDGSLKVGALIAFLTYLIQILMAIMMVTFIAVIAPRASVSADRISEVLDTESSVRPPHNPIRKLRSTGTMALNDVSFAYPGAEQPVLRNLTLAVDSGKTTAVIGSTGAGKTTLVNLFPRLFDATGGEVLVDGVDVRELDPDLLWSRIGLVPQKPFLFSATASRMQPTTSCGRPSRPRRRTASSPKCPAGSTAPSPRAEPTCRAASDNGSRSPGPSSSGRNSTSSTTRSRRSIRQRMRGSVRRS